MIRRPRRQPKRSACAIQLQQHSSIARMRRLSLTASNLYPAVRDEASPYRAGMAGDPAPPLRGAGSRRLDREPPRSRVRQVRLVARDREVRALCRWVPDKENRMRRRASHELISLSMKGIAPIDPCTHPHQVAGAEWHQRHHDDRGSPPQVAWMANDRWSAAPPGASRRTSATAAMKCSIGSSST